MLKFLLQTFYQSLFSHSFPFNNFPLAIFFPSVILIPSKSFSHQKPQSKSQKPKPKKTSQSKIHRQKSKKPQALIKTAANRVEQRLLERGGDIVTGETCVPVSLNTSLEDAAALLFSLCSQGCA
jgi:hypothetical protein